MGASGRSDNAIREILKDLDGILTLNAWEATLLRDVKEKAANLIGDGGGHTPPSNPPPEETGADCVDGGGDSAV